MVLNIERKLRNKSGIYVIKPVNSNDNRRYFGLAKNLYKRFERHRSEIRGNRHRNPKLQNFYTKYGDQSLVFEVIETYDFYDREFLMIREQIYLDLLFKEKTYIPFNIHEISFCKEGIPLTLEQRKKISEGNKGKKGRTPSIDERTLLSEQFGRPISVLKKDGTFFKKYSSVLEASRELDIPHKVIKDILYLKILNKTEYKFSFAGEKKITRKTRGDVCKYDVNGKYLMRYASTLDAASSIENGNCDIIGQACREINGRPWLGFYWRFDNSESPKDLDPKSINLPRTKNKNSKRVKQVDKEGNVVATYDSPPDAARKTGLDRRKIQKSCSGSVYYFGFKWYYIG